MQVKITWRIERNIKELDGELSEREGNVNRDEKSEWKEVKSGVPQGSVFATLIFLIYVNYMTEGVSSYMSVCR